MPLIAIFALIGHLAIFYVLGMIIGSVLRRLVPSLLTIVKNAFKH